MAKADKTDTSSEEKKDVAQPAADDIIDAEIVDEATEASEELNDVVTENAAELPESDGPVDVDDIADDAAEDQPKDDDAPVLESPFVISDDAIDIEPSDDDTPAEDIAEELADPITPPAPTPSPQVVKKTGFMPVVLGGAVAAVLGFGAAQYVGPLFATENEEITALEAALAGQSDQLSAVLAQQAAAADQMTATQDQSANLLAAVEGLTASVSAVNGRIDDAAEALVTLDGRLTALEKRPITQGLPSSAIEAYERELEALKQSVTAQREAAANMEANAKLTAQQALSRAALSRVLAALDSGAAYRVALMDFSATTGAAIPDALSAHAESGVPTLAELQASFPAAARAALAASRQTSEGEGNGITSFLKAQLGARSVTPQDGDSADAILSRAEEALRAGRVTDTIADLQRMPDLAKPALADWLAQAAMRQDAFAAGEALSQQLNAN